MSGGGGGMTAPGPTAQEVQNQELQNQLLQQQLADAAKSRAAEAEKQSAPYLQSQLANTRAAQQTAFNNSKNTAYQQARQNIINQFTSFGDPGAAAPYLAALDNEYNSLAYRAGGDYSVQGATGGTPDTRVTIDNFDAQRYLAANPDVAQDAARRGVNPITAAQQHFITYGQAEGRTYKDATAASAGTTVAPIADTWDDPNKLLNTDFGAGAYLTGQRQQRKDAAYTSAVGNANSYLDALGLDDATMGALRSQTSTRLQQAYNNAGLSANDYTNVFDPQSILDAATGTVQNARRGEYTTKVNSLFSGLDPNKAFADTADDSYISDIVGKQYTDASLALDRARARGALTDSGYNSGMSYLGDQRGSAMSSAQSLGGAVLQRNRDTLGGIKKDALSSAGSYTLGSSFDPNTFLNQYNTKQASLSEGLGGDISNALAGQNWFDVGDVLTKAGYAQGAQNTAALSDGFSTPAGLAALDANKKKNDSQRGLGGVGVF